MFFMYRTALTNGWQQLARRYPPLCYWMAALGLPLALLAGVTATVAVVVLPVSIFMGWL